MYGGVPLRIYLNISRREVLLNVSSLLSSRDVCSFFRLCKAVDDKLAAILEDAQHFFFDTQKAPGPEIIKRTSVSKAFELSLFNKNKTISDETEPFDRFGIANQIQSFLRETCFSAFSQ